MRKRIIFTGNSNRPLAERVAARLGEKLGEMEVGRFSDGEIKIKNVRNNVRDNDVFIIQSTNPPAENILELLFMIDTVSRAGAGRIIPVIPYFGYARQDRKIEPRTPISASLVAMLIKSASLKVEQVITIDLHNSAIEGYFPIPVNHVYAKNILINYFEKKLLAKGHNLQEDLVIVAPDTGATRRARDDFATYFKCRLIIIDKRRIEENESEVMNIIGEVDGKICIIADDMIDTAGTITQGAAAIKARGAKEIYACATHALLSGKAVERIENSAIKEIVFTDTLVLPEEKMLKKFKKISVDQILAETIRAVNTGESVSHINNMTFEQ
ncbi:MAG: ribose-phosphate pyrophosphokinase [Patescibacteria group bacterium]|nr:ribose-phosphate pyrophosphokinase [Patescibacteria group bacterium]MDD5490472.1 ribose-phosphate pyrophosphokinase [Patescibacteria group bacterium]